MNNKREIINKISLGIYFMIIFGFLFNVSSQETKVETPSSLNQSQSDQSEEKKFVVDLDFRDVDMREIARAFSHISGKNIIVSEDVKAKVTLRIQSMDWKEALNMILSANNLTMIEKEDYIVITTFEKRKLAEEAGTLFTEIITLNFVNVADIQKTLNSILTPRGKIEIDPRTNSLVVTDILERIDKIRKIALTLDTKTPQVMIEAMMVDVKLTDEDLLGIDWKITHKDRPEREITQSFGTGSVGGVVRYGKTLLPWAHFTGLINLWREEKRAEILANPKVLTLDNYTAAIDLVEEVPYKETTTTSEGGQMTSTVFKSVGIKLYVKPHITKDNYIFLNIQTEQSYETGRTVDNIPVIDTRRAATNFLVKEGETIVIGGLRKKEITDTVDKIPILGNIPFLSRVFKKTAQKEVDSELLIFVTSYIVGTETEFTPGEKKYIQKFEKMRLEKEVVPFMELKPFSLRPPTSKE